MHYPISDLVALSQVLVASCNLITRTQLGGDSRIVLLPDITLRRQDHLGARCDKV